MSALSGYLDLFQMRTNPGGYFQGFAQHITGAPNDNTSPFFLFTIDDSTGKVYINPDRTSSSWVEIASADVLAPTTITI